MATYGRNFEFRVPPMHGQRGGRYVLDGDIEKVAIGAPVRWNGENSDVNGLLPVELATGASAPVKGQCGVLVYEADNAAGLDPLLNGISDVDSAPNGKQVQVVSGDMVKFVIRNSEDRVFLNTRSYTGKTMFAGEPQTGDFLTPGAGTDQDGYWAVTANAAEAWLVVESFDEGRNEVEARFVF